MTRMQCADARDLIDAYALDALDAAEAEAVARHLETCGECRRALEEATAAAEALPLALAAASPLRPPAGLKERVLASTSAAPADHGVLVALPTTPQLVATNGATRTASAASRLRLVGRPGWLSGRVAAVAAVVLVLGASLAWGVRLSEALDRERETRAQLELFYSQQQELVLEIVDSPQTTRLVLRPPAEDAGSAAYGKVFTRPEFPDVVVMVARLPAPPDGQAYHVWLTAGERTMLAGTFSVDKNGFGLMVYRADRAGPTFDLAVVTLQPVGDAAPGGTTVLSWRPEPPAEE